MKRLLTVLLLLAVVAGLGYYPLVMHSPSPGGAPYLLDLEAVRGAAQSLPGARPQRVEVEQIAELVFAQAMVMAGEPWQGTPIPVYSYRLQFPDRSIIVDTAMSNTEGMPGAMVRHLDSAALERLYRAMDQASLILITHEHFDHIGGLLAHPRLAELLPRTLLTAEQLAHQDRMRPLSLPDGVFADYRPLDYQNLHAVAPGVVLIKAPGHTPGSQIIYVQQADGSELLLLGDVSWQYRNIEAVRERPLFMTALIKEDREQVINQFQTLNGLARQHPEVHLLPGHDGEVVRRLLAQGVLRAGFGDGQARAE